MGDVVSLVEKAQREVSDDDAKSLQDKMAKGEMTMDDFLKQLRTLRRMGPLKQLLGLLPGLGSVMKDVHIEDKELDKIEAMIQSMTRAERAQPGSINFSRRRRIARGSGTKEEDVGKLAKQFEMVSKVTRDLATLSGKDRAATLREIGPGATGALPPGMRGLLGGRGSSAAPAKTHFKKRRK
jgi:signal recognition particle subunit SRP54